MIYCKDHPQHWSPIQLDALDNIDEYLYEVCPEEGTSWGGHGTGWISDLTWLRFNWTNSCLALCVTTKFFPKHNYGSHLFDS